MRLNYKTHNHKTRQCGFSMIEILITLVLVAIAVLGTAGLQLNALRLNKGSQSRTQAIFLATDMVERMEANKVAAFAGNYALVSTNASGVAATDCVAAVCSSSSLAAWDLSQWGQTVSTLLPTASWAITQTQVGNATTFTPASYTIQISWVERSDAKVAGSSSIQDMYTATRSISN